MLSAEDLAADLMLVLCYLSPKRVKSKIFKKLPESSEVALHLH